MIYGEERKKQFRFNLNSYFFPIFICLSLVFYLFFLNIKYSNKTHDLLIKKIPLIKKDISELENKIHAEDLKKNSLFSDIKNNPEYFGMRKAKPNNDIIRWIE